MRGSGGRSKGFAPYRYYLERLCVVEYLALNEHIALLGTAEEERKETSKIFPSMRRRGKKRGGSHDRSKET
ncbi:hypothetical protein MUK42_13752 [Musa troglodytarum]|uniref:Uncharacterized protein n=1 Tax=Musa troglodytarum TaxID=320322 RepID=A0A9E7KVL0_9LILI|nr:hypothetical protein MUK42_13752 [Musa troglodytarum]